VHMLYPPPPAGTDPHRGELLGGNHWNPVTRSVTGTAANLGTSSFRKLLIRPQVNERRVDMAQGSALTR